MLLVLLSVLPWAADHAVLDVLGWFLFFLFIFFLWLLLIFLLFLLLVFLKGDPPFGPYFNPKYNAKKGNLKVVVFFKKIYLDNYLTCRPVASAPSLKRPPLSPQPGSGEQVRNPIRKYGRKFFPRKLCLKR